MRYTNELSTLLKARFTAIDFKHIQQDVAPFLANPDELRFFTQDYFLALVDKLKSMSP